MELACLDENLGHLCIIYSLLFYDLLTRLSNVCSLHTYHLILNMTYSSPLVVMVYISITSSPPNEAITINKFLKSSHVPFIISSLFNKVPTSSISVVCPYTRFWTVNPGICPLSVSLHVST